MAERPINRRLAAILAADVVGYSRMMAADEGGTLAALKRHREELFNPTVAHYNGRVVKLIGDAGRVRQRARRAARLTASPGAGTSLG
jgi:adenylate cyclase